MSLLKKDSSALSFWTSVSLSASNELMTDSTQQMLKQLDGMVTVEHMMSLFVSTVMQQDAPVVMVVDDLHRSTEEAQHQLLDVASRLPQMKLVITSRSETPFETRLSQGAFNVTVIDSHELAFTPSEIKAVSDSVVGDLDHAELRILRRITKGHTLATRLGLGVMQTLKAKDERRDIAEIARAVDDAAAGHLPSFPGIKSEIRAHCSSDRSWNRDMVPRS